MNATIARLRSSAVRSARISPRVQAPAPLVYRAAWRAAILLCDVGAVSVAFTVATFAVWHVSGARPSFGAAVVSILILIVGYAAHDLHEKTCAILRRDEFYYGAATTLLLGVPIVLVCAVIDMSAVSRSSIALGVALSIVLVGTLRYLLRALAGDDRLFEPSADGDACDRCSKIHMASSRVRWAKRLADIVVAGIALPFALAIIALAALATRLEGSGPIFYRQRRVGRDGRAFDIIKLRTMRTDAETRSGPVWAVSGDARVTRVGRVLRRLSIDELPQLFNVLRGEMSIVGPRPERPAFVEQFSRENPKFIERLTVAPGLTACSHLYMPRIVDTAAVERRLEYDLFYIRHWSLAMDLALVMKTAAEVVFHRAA